MAAKQNDGFVGDDRSSSYSSFSAAINSTEQLTKEKGNSAYTAVELKELQAKENEKYDPYQHREIDHPTTNLETLIHLLKGSLGTGILAMPLAFHHSGYVVGTISTILIGVICTYCIHMLIKAEYELCRRKGLPSLTYPSCMECALQEGPPLFQKMAPYSPHITNVFLLTYQLGTCCVYTVFIGENIQMVCDHYFENSVDARVIMVIFLLPLILINYIKNLKLLAPLTSIANVMTLVSFGIILYYLVIEEITLENRKPVGSLREFPLYFGTVLFALEAIGVIMPLENEMKSPHSFGGTCGVLNIGMISIIVLYTLMGLFGYLAYGPEVRGSISYTLDGTQIPAQVCKILLAFAMYISHALQMYVAIDIVWNQYLQPRLEKNRHQTFWEYVVRTFLVVLTFSLAVAVPYIDLFISLFGALCLSALGLAFPAIIDSSTNWYQLKGVRGALILFKNSLLVVIAIIGLVIGTETSIQGIVEKFASGNSTE